MYAEERTEHFDTDPGWYGLNNRSTSEMRPVVQDFGYRPAAGGAPASIGGTITPDGHPAYYAKPIAPLSFDTPIRASGNLTVKKGGGNVLLGFFNSKTVNEWRTPNSLVFRINGRGDTFHAHIEYCTSKWRAGAGIFGTYDKAADRMYAIENRSGGSYRWTMAYDPNGNNGAGCLTATLNETTAVMNIDPELRKDGALFNHF
ncbi:MAG: hypothetical protein FJY92_05780, partial [Candidatus Hydrogenedentes bacterium]|nr:hypothetical protein [Candidatus Hydrogenedentota bacterium]